MRRYLITGTDTDVGKTRITAAFATALRIAGENPTVVKLVQTGLEPGAVPDAVRAAALAHCPHVELARFTKAADPWSAALAEGLPTVRAEDLARVLATIYGAVVAEGAGGLAVPLNRSQNFATVASLAHLSVIIVVGLRLGCMNHALLTLSLCDQLQLPVAGGILVERWEKCDPSYTDDVYRALQGKMEILGIVPFDPDEAASVEHAAQLFVPLL
jgi:dethiobiotin synthetase